MDSPYIALRGAYLTFTDDPFVVGDDTALHYEPDGLIVVHQGRQLACGPFRALREQWRYVPVHHYKDHLILPGFIDSHVHFPQTQIIGSYGKQLIDWLNDYTFVAEQQFADPNHARKVADTFLTECLRAGTTTAAVYCTVHPASVDAFFSAAQAKNLRMVAGKVMMDRNAPEALLDTAQQGYDDSLALIERWHGRDRLHYAITPRFAPTSSPAQLEAAGTLWRQFPDTYLQTHLSENEEELAWVRRLFPDRKHYTDVYAHYGLTGPRALFGHAIHLAQSEWDILSASGSSVIHCPTSNAFLGSGLFNMERARNGAQRVRTGLATDVGGGTSLSLLRTMQCAYTLAQFRRYSLSAPKAFYLATLGNAQALHLDDRIGKISPGYDADLVVMDMRSTPLIDFRMQRCSSLTEALFVQMTLGDDRAIHAVYAGGDLVHQRNENAP